LEDAGILPRFAGVAVSDRYQNYFNPRWEHIAGNQACLSHLLRDFEDCAESYPGAVWPAQAPRALRALIGERHAAREQGLSLIPAAIRDPLAHELRHAVLAGLASVPAIPARRTAPSRNQAASCRNPAATAAVYGLLLTEDTSVWPTNNISERGARPPENTAENLRPPHQRRRHPGPPRHQKLHRHRPQARQEHHGRPARPHARHPPGDHPHRHSPRNASRNPHHRAC
jgi:hypothetical protein